MRKKLKLPNGFGCIKKLTGNRRKPYAAFLGSKIDDEKPQMCPKRVIGYYDSWYSAYNTLSDFNRNLLNGITSAAPVSDIFHAFYIECILSIFRRMFSRGFSQNCIFSGIYSCDVKPDCSWL